MLDLNELKNEYKNAKEELTKLAKMKAIRLMEDSEEQILEAVRTGKDFAILEFDVIHSESIPYLLENLKKAGFGYRSENTIENNKVILIRVDGWAE